jgi:hypothetical protein
MPMMPSLLPQMRWHDQRHGHVGRIFGEHARGVGDSDAASHRRLDIDIVDTGAEIGDEFEPIARLADHCLVDAVGNGRDQDLGLLDRLDQLGAAEGVVVRVEPGIEQLHHPGLDHVRELAGDDDQGFALGHKM